jgi:uncharacterized protein YutE (UPF0331/DUF86 family)
VDESRLETDRIVRHAVERIITQLVDLAVSVNSHISAAVAGEAPTTYRDSFSAAAKAGAISPELAAELSPSAGLRNILTHEYATIDIGLVAQAIPEAVGGYRRYITQVARFLLDRADAGTLQPPQA